MPEVVKSMIYLHADDAKAARRILNGSDRCTLQQDLDNLDVWAKEWQMKFSADKCKVMRVASKNDNESPYSLEQGMEVRIWK